jgi:hypothetical protein
LPERRGQTIQRFFPQASLDRAVVTVRIGGRQAASIALQYGNMAAFKGVAAVEALDLTDDVVGFAGAVRGA